MKNRKFATILIVILSLPALFFLIFMFGEVFSGDISGLGHLLQAAPFLLIIFFIYRRFLGKKTK